MRDRIIKILVATIYLFTITLLLSSFQKIGAQNINELNINPHYKISSPPLPDSFSFCGEPTPLKIQDVRERLDRELMVNMYWQSNQLLLFKRAGRWFSVIEPILKEEGVPDDFKYLALIESGFLNTGSSAGAMGFWQLLKSTAIELGLQVDKYVDQRLDIEKSTRAACSMLKKMYAKYGNWTLAAAAYNTGQGNIDYHWKTQGIHSYYDLHLPVETSRYIFRILAEKLIFSKPEDYGFYFKSEDLYYPYEYRYVSVDTSIQCLFEFAKEQDVLYKDLKKFNPWLMERTLPNKEGRKYKIALPVNKIVETQDEAFIEENIKNKIKEMQNKIFLPEEEQNIINRVKNSIE